MVEKRNQSHNLSNERYFTFRTVKTKKYTHHISEPRGSVEFLKGLSKKYDTGMKESINLIGGLLGYVCQHELLKYVKLLNMSNV